MEDNYTGLTAEEMNHILPYIYRGDPVEECIEDNADIDAELLRGFWERTVQWMVDNPLPPGHVYDMAPE